MKTEEATTGTPQPGKAVAGLHYFLPRGVIDITGTVDAEKKGYTVELARRNEADRRKRYRLVQQNNVLYEDVSTFKVDAQGLLTEEMAISSDSKVADTFYNLTTTALNVAKIYAKMTGASPMTAMTKEQPALTELQSFKVSFDPLIPGEVAEARRRVAAAGLALEVEVPPLAIQAARDPVQVAGKLSPDGVYYRPLTTVKVRVTCTQSAQIALYQNVPIPDVQALAVYALKRGAFTKRETKLAFVTGEPRSMTHTSPSEAMAATAIPVRVTGDLLAALPSLGSLVYRPTPGPNAKLNADTERLKAETAAIQANTEALKARQAAEAAAQQGGGMGGGAAEMNAARTGFGTAAAMSAMTAAADERTRKQAEYNEKTLVAPLERRLEEAEKRLKALDQKEAGGPPHVRDAGGEILPALPQAIPAPVEKPKKTNP